MQCMISIKKGSFFTLVGLYVLTIPFFNALNVTSYDNSQILGHFGASTIEFSYSTYIPFFAMLGFLPLSLKIAKQIKIRTMILSVSFLSIICNTASLYADTIEWFTVWRSLLAILSIIGIFASLLPILMKYNPVFNMPILYGIVQFIMQGSKQLYQYFGTEMTSIHNWTFSIYFLNINFLLAILLAWVFYKKDFAPMKTPFQFDWRGWIIILLFFAIILFICAEGQTRNWFSDPKIAMAFAFLLIVIGVYLIHVRLTQAPLINTDVYQYRNVVLGSLLFFYTGMMNGTGSIVTGFMTNILGFDSIYVARTHLAILIGLFIAIPLSTYLLFKRIYLSTIWVLGFACYGMYHAILYFRFYPEIDAADFFGPFIFKGLAIGFLYPAASLYISENVPKPLGDSRMMSGVIARVIFASLLGGAILGTAINNLNVQHKTGLSQQLTTLNPLAQAQLNKSKYYYLSQGQSESNAQKNAEKNLSNQTAKSSLMLAYKDIYLVMSVLCFFPILILLLFKIARRPVGSVGVEPIPF
jgi:MFS transporter, DHA2 family, multidrug resistance protein